MDWGLFDRAAGENTFLREEIVYPHKVKSETDEGMEHTRSHTVTVPPGCLGLLLLCHCGGRDPSFCLDHPDFSDYDDPGRLGGGHRSHRPRSS